MNLDLLFIIIANIFFVLGLIGCIVPVLPGPPLAYIGILFIHFTEKYHFTPLQLIIYGAAALIVTILDYYIPILGTKYFKGSKKGIWGSVIGLAAGIIFTPIGMLVGAFLGAFIGELIGQKPVKDALKAAIGTFSGFLLGILLKFVICIYFVFVFIRLLF